MKTNKFKRLDEYNPAKAGAQAVQDDERAMNDKNWPFGYYADEFRALEDLRQKVINLQFNYFLNLTM